MLRKSWQRASLAAVLLAGSFAGSATASTSTSTWTPASASATASPHARTFDEALVAVDQAVPGFAGAWIDGEGALVVAMARPAGNPAAARRELARVLGRPELGAMRVATQPARYRFGDLKAWHDAVSHEALAIDGVLSSDVDERANVVRIGASDVAGTEARIRTIAATHGVPPQALVVDHEEPVVEQGLRERNSPAVGGIEISWVESKTASFYQCTLGFPAVRDGVLGYVTNSHCTTVRGSVDNTVHQQPLFGLPIGHEIADPPHVASAACPTGRLCRYSDSSFYTLHADALYNHGHVARPAPDSIAWNGTDLFRITAEATPLMGETMTKVGRTSGRTSGGIKGTCKTFNVISFNLTMLCQGQADYWSDGGDSGSPVFTVTSGDDITLKGIHWGSFEGGGGAVFSPIDGIQRSTELGPLTTCATGFNC